MYSELVLAVVQVCSVSLCLSGAGVYSKLVLAVVQVCIVSLCSGASVHVCTA